MHIADVFREYQQPFEAKYAGRILPSYRKAIAAILRCRAPEAGIIHSIAPPVATMNGMRVPADTVAVRNAKIMKHPVGWIDNVKSCCLSITF